MRDYGEVCNKRIPDNATLYQYPSLNGKELLDKILAENSGKTIYIDVWATYCSPCKRQIPHSLKMQKIFKEVEFVYLCYESGEEAWRNVIRQYQINGTHVLLNQEQFEFLKTKFSIAGVPHYILIDENGTINFNDYPGCKTEQVIENRLMNLTAKV